MKDICNMTSEQEELLAEKLLGRMVRKLRDRDTVIVPGETKSQNVTTRIIDSGMISTETRAALQAARSATSEATDIDTLKAAALAFEDQLLKILDVDVE